MESANKLSRQKCKNHPQREAAARCHSCGYFYCSECCTEHSHRLLCASCIDLLKVKRTDHGSSVFRIVALAVSSIISFMVIWFLMFIGGDLLLAIPDKWLESPAETAAEGTP